MARTRKPTAIHEANRTFEHNPDRGRARENEPVPDGPIGNPPEYFDEIQKKIWAEVVQQCPFGVLTIADRMIVEIYCSLVGRFRSGETLKAAEYNLIISILSRMGLTPADRSKINVPTKESKQEGPGATTSTLPRLIPPTV